MEGSRALDTAVEAARRAGDLLLGFFGSLDPSEVEEKGRNDVVSRADKESEALVKEVLLGAFAGDLFVGEEGGVHGRDGDAPAWIVDPLDGTANFVRGFPHWAVSIGRTAGGASGELVLGVVWDPVKKDLFVAEKGAGAFRNGFTKSFTITVEIELIPESMLDIAAAKIAVTINPETPLGRD